MSVHVVVFDADWGDAAKPLPANIIVIIIYHSLCFFFQLKEINCYFFCDVYTFVYFFFLNHMMKCKKRKSKQCRDVSDDRIVCSSFSPFCVHC